MSQKLPIFSTVYSMKSTFIFNRRNCDGHSKRRAEKSCIFHSVAFLSSSRSRSNYLDPREAERLREADLDLERVRGDLDLEARPLSERGERDLDLDLESASRREDLWPLFSSISLILRPSSSVLSSLSKAYSSPRRSPNSTMLEKAKLKLKYLKKASVQK